jgi:hypothetical protein
VEAAVVRAVDLDELCRVTLQLALLGVTAPEVPEADRAELPDLGGAFNDQLHWQALAAALPPAPPPPPPPPLPPPRTRVR